MDIAAHISETLSVVIVLRDLPMPHLERIPISKLDAVFTLCGVGNRSKSSRELLRTHYLSIQCIVTAKYPRYTDDDHLPAVKITVPDMSLNVIFMRLS